MVYGGYRCDEISGGVSGQQYYRTHPGGVDPFLPNPVVSDPPLRRCTFAAASPLRNHRNEF